MNWGDIKELILGKLFLTEEEAEQQNYLEKMLPFANEALVIIANEFKARLVLKKIEADKPNFSYTFGDDFLSFSGRTIFRDGEPNPHVIHITNNSIQLPKEGTYYISYNALWGDIEEKVNSGRSEITIPEGIDRSVLQCIPLYVASQLLGQDDIQRSMILRNEFEVMCSRLEEEINENSSFYSQGGWY